MHHSNIKIYKSSSVDNCKEGTINILGTYATSLQFIKKVNIAIKRLESYWINSQESTLKTKLKMLIFIDYSPQSK